MINREELKSEWLEWDNGKPVRVEILSDGEKQTTEKPDGRKYSRYILKVKRVTGNMEAKKLGLFKSQLQKLVKQADKKYGSEIPSLVGTVIDYKVTITETEKGTDWDTKIEVITVPKNS